MKKKRIIFLMMLFSLILSGTGITLAQPQHFHPCWEGKQPFSPMNIFIVEAKYNGQDLVKNDEIGIFDGTLCVGAGVVTGTINFTNFLETIASKDDGLTGLGFKEGNKILFKIWDASANQEFSIADGEVKFLDPQTGNPINPVPFTGLGTAVVSISGAQNKVDLWIPTDLSGAKGATIAIPINSSDFTGLLVYSAGIEITYDAAVLEVTGTDISGTILSASGWGPPTSSISTGQIKLAMAGSAPLAGSGILVKITGKVLGNEGAATALHFKSAILNEGSPLVFTKDGLLKVISAFDIKGRLGYYSNQTLAVKDAKVQLSGAATKSFNSDANGNYEFLDLIPGNYTVKPEKVNDVKNAVTPYDASIILQFSVGSITLTPYQKIAGDVSGNGSVTSYDASFILRYYVGSVATFPVGADWTFVPHDFQITDANWSTSPRSRSYTPLQSDRLGQDFISILYGDVSGNWSTSSTISSTNFVELEAGAFEQGNDGKWSLPLLINFTGDVHSGSFKFLLKNPDLMFVTNSIDNSSTQNLLLSANSSKGFVALAFASGQILNSQQLKINLIFERSNFDPPSSLDVELNEIIIDEKVLYTTAIKAMVGSVTPTEWSLSQNQPNPFNAETSISYQVSRSSHVTIEVFNLLGQRLVTLVDEVKNPGTFKNIWNGKDDQGQLVGSGIYLYRLQADHFTAIKKMVLVQ